VRDKGVEWEVASGSECGKAVEFVIKRLRAEEKRDRGKADTAEVSVSYEYDLCIPVYCIETAG
jgi:hypothetical protein